MKKLAITSIFGLAFAITLGFGFIPSMEQSASCAECDSDNLPGVRKAFEAFDAECKKQLTAGEDQRKGCFTSNIYNKILPIMKAFSKDNRFGPGDRILFVGESQNGSLLIGADRGFQTVAPIDKDSLTVEIKKTDGGNGALVKVCTIDASGNLKREDAVTFPEDNSTDTKTMQISNVKGKIVRIQVASSGSALKKFKYTLSTR